MTTLPRSLPRSLQGRLLVLVLAVVGTVWLAAAVLTWVDVKHELDELLDSHLAQAAALLVVQQAGELGENEDDEHAPRVEAPTLHRYAPKVAFQVFHEGRLVLRSAQAPVAPMVPGALQADGRLRPAAEGFSTVQIDGKSWRVFSAQGAEQDVQVYVGEQTGSRADILQAVLRSTLAPLALALPLLALAAGWAVYRGLLPLRRLGRVLAQRPPQDSQPVVMADAPSEMQPLLASLNGLLSRIGALVESERRFTADAAHELRTPIAAIRAQAQVALAATQDDAVRAHALLSTLAGCDRASRLVEQLLTLSRLEAGAAPAMERLDLAALVQREVADLAPQALDKNQTLELQAPAAVPARGNATLLAALVRNLVDNAVRYSPAGATVHVSVRSTGTGSGMGAQLCVADSGPGLGESDLQRLGERFFRVLGGGQPGSGLGWSIVRRIAAVHGAQVQVQRSAELGGLEVRVVLPHA